jgi:hypothetical protein
MIRSEYLTKESPEWQPRTISEMFYNATEALAAESALVNTLDYPLYIGNIGDDTDLADKGTNSAVRKSNSSFRQIMPGIYTNGEEFSVIKDNKTDLDNNLERKVSKLVEKSGFQVAQIVNQNGTLKITNLGYKNRFDVALQELYTQLLITSKLHSDADETLTRLENEFYKKGLELSVLGAEADYKINNALNDKTNKENMELATDLETARKSRIKTPNQFDTDLSKKDEYLMNMLQMLPGADDELIKGLEPIAEKLAEGYAKYGSWSLDVKPKNAFYDATGQKIILNDFNRVKHMSMQEADALIIDSYLPSRNNVGLILSSILPVITPQGPLLNPFSEDEKQDLIDERIKTRNEMGANIDTADYKKNLTPARIYHAIRNSGYAMNRLATTEDLKNVVTNYFEFYHNFTLMQSSLEELGKEEQDNYHHYKPVIHKIRDLTAKNLNKAIPSTVLEAAMDFGASIDFTPQIIKYESKLAEELDKRDLYKRA